MSAKEEKQLKENLETLEAIHKESSNQDTYTVSASCSNCDFSSAIQVDVGIEVRELKCPECKCLTLWSSPMHAITIGSKPIRIETKSQN